MKVEKETIVVHKEITYVKVSRGNTSSPHKKRRKRTQVKSK